MKIIIGNLLQTTMKQILQKVKQSIYHTFKLYPIYKVLAEINNRIPLKGCNALEAFAYTGAWQAKAYRNLPAYHEAWEIEAWCKPLLENNLPNATIKITNSFEEVLKCTTKFDFINVDTHQGIYGAYCENFEFFPLLFNVTKDECIVNLNVMPNASEYWLKRYEGLFSKEHLERRNAFYKTGKPEDVTLEQMLKAYSEIATKNGYSIVWHYYKQRTLTYYLVLHLKKNI